VPKKLLKPKFDQLIRRSIIKNLIYYPG